MTVVQNPVAGLQALGLRIAENSRLVDEWLARNKFQTPTFDQNADDEFPSTAGDPAVDAARLALLEDANTLHDLVLGPGEVLRRICWGVRIEYQG